LGGVKEKKPAKSSFPVDFRRAREFSVQYVDQLAEPGYRESDAQCGIVVVESFSDVLGLATHGRPAVAIMSNRITEQQAASTGSPLQNNCRASRRSSRCF
jgi:hypothetical protein